MSDKAKQTAAVVGIITALALANLAAETFANMRLPYGLDHLFTFGLLIGTVVVLAVAAFKVTAPQPTARSRRLDELERQGEHITNLHQWQRERYEERRNR